MGCLGTALSHWCFCLLPGGQGLFHRIRVGLLHRLPVDDAELDRRREEMAPLLALVEELAAADPGRRLRIMEFGAGFDLLLPILCAARLPGRLDYLVIDRQPIAFPAVVDDMLRRIGGGGSLDRMGIRYVAPSDARRTGLPEGSLDLVLSASTLEHIPVPELAAIAAEAGRILRPGGLYAARIDYVDHWSYLDPRVGPKDHLLAGPVRWRLINTPLNWQNRLSHRQHLQIIAAAGLTPVREERWPLPAARHPGQDARFAGLPLDPLDLGTAAGFIVARR